MQIRFMIETVSSRADIYGNRYHFATITSTKTGRSEKFMVHGGHNAVSYVMSALDMRHGQYLHTNCELPIRQFNRAARGIEKWEHDITEEALLSLEQ